MKKLLLLFCILSITLTAKSQIFSKNFKTGSYTDSSGRRFAGLVFYTLPEASIFKTKEDHIFFKATKDAEKQKISSDLISSFVIEKDSFTVSHLPTLEKFPFLKVILNQKTKLYFSAIIPSAIPLAGAGLIGGALAGAAMGGKGSSAYYFGNDPDHLTILKNKTFIEVMSNLMADKPEAVKKIRNGEFKFSSITDLLVYYKTGVLPKKLNDDVY